MKFPRTITIIVMLLLTISYMIFITPKKRAYTIIITNGNSSLCYSAEMQVDSFTNYKNNSMVVYVDTIILPIKGDIITFKKN